MRLFIDLTKYTTFLIYFKNKKILKGETLDITLWDKAVDIFPETEVLEEDINGPVIIAILSVSIRRYNGN